MSEQPYPIGSVVRLEGDKRYPEPRLCRVLDNGAFPLYYVRVSTAGASQAPAAYNEKLPATAVTHSKLTLVKS